MSQQPPQQEQGFALTEVLVAILITTFFVAVSMQALVIAAIFKARAQETAEATTWIQEDLENVKYSAASLQYTSLFVETTDSSDPDGPPDPDPLLHEITDQVLHVASVDGFQKGDALKVGTDSINNKIINEDKIIIKGKEFKAIDPVSKTITLTEPLGTIQPRGALVVAITRCNLIRTTGFADHLRDQLIGRDEEDKYRNDFGNPPSTGNKLVSGVPLESKLSGRKFGLTRTTIIPDTAPYNVLEVSYSVAPLNAHTTLTAATDPTTSSLSVTSATGFKVGDKLTVGTDADNEIASISGTTITLKSPLDSVQSFGSTVSSVSDTSIAKFYTEIIPNAAFQCS